MRATGTSSGPCAQSKWHRTDIWQQTRCASRPNENSSHLTDFNLRKLSLRGSSKASSCFTWVLAC